MHAGHAQNVPVAGGQVMHHYASLKPKYLLTLWLRHLALQAGAQAAGSRSAIITRFAKPPFYAAQEFVEVSRGDAALRLAELLELFAEGSTRPLPFFPSTSHAYTKAYLNAVEKKGADAARATARASAARAWEGDSYNGIAGDKDDSSVARVFAGAAPFIDDSDGFHEVALKVFEPLLDSLQEVPL